jgi:hypothetical protein
VRLIWLLVGIAVLEGCGKPTAGGSIREVRVLCGERVWERVGAELRRAVETPIHTVEPETVFSLVRAAVGDFQNVRLSANLLLVGALDSPDSVGEILRKLLTPETQEAVQRRESLVFARSDLWANRQRVTIVTAPDEETLVEFILRARDFLFETIYAPLAAKAVGRVYYRGGNKELRQVLHDEYGWSVLVPTPWHMVAAESESLVYFYKNEPDRHLMVYWEEEQRSLHPDSCLALRERLVWRHYDEDEVDRSRTLSAHTMFLGRPALRLEGVWQNEKHIMGGPFRTYCFHSSAQNRFYLVDLNVFAPGREKFPYLAQLEGIAASFRCLGEKSGL